MTSSTPQDSINTLVIDLDTAARTRLKQICHSLKEFGHFEQTADFRMAMQRINGLSKKIDTVFISSKFSNEEIGSFIEWAKQIDSTENAAFVILRRRDEEVALSEHTILAGGSDGVLFEPYSTDNLGEIYDLTLRVKRERAQERLMNHLQITANDILVVLNHMAFLQSTNFAVTPVLRQFRKLASLLESLPGDQVQAYYQALIERLENPPEHAPFPVRYKYSGKSLRARRRMQRKALAALGYDNSEL